MADIEAEIAGQFFENAIQDAVEGDYLCLDVVRVLKELSQRAKDVPPQAEVLALIIEGWLEAYREDHPDAVCGVERKEDANEAN